MWAIIYVGSNCVGFYVADDEDTTHDLATALKYATEQEAKDDAAHMTRTREEGHTQVVKVSG